MPQLVKSAEILLNQINKRWPTRYKRRDGWIGSKNNHCPDETGMVYALDIDENLLGIDQPYSESLDECSKLADQLIELARRGKDGGRIKYVAYKKRIASGTRADEFWIWRPLRRGFEKHIHISFNECDKQKEKHFPLEVFTEPSFSLPKIKKNVPKFPGSEKLCLGKKNIGIRKMQEQLCEKGFCVSEDELGRYGESTALAVSAFYRSIGINSGIIARDGSRFGAKAWERLFSE